MKTPVMERTSAAKAGWLIIALTIGWLVFLLLPEPVPEPAARSMTVPLPASSLIRAGLRDYTDWEGLPEIFAIWADKADWKDNRTRFAYWHPVVKSYSYFFEAKRVNGGYRFREIAEPHDPDYFWDDGLGDECPIRFFKPNQLNSPVAGPAPWILKQPVANEGKPRVPVKIPQAELPPAAPKS